MEVPTVSVKKILYATDLSDTGRHAFAYAASLANLYGADLTVFHVLEEGPELDKRLAGYISEEMWEEIKQGISAKRWSSWSSGGATMPRFGTAWASSARKRNSVSRRWPT